MKKKHILLPLLAALLYILLSSYSGGPGLAAGLERTGATGTVGCGGGCHSPSATATTTVAIQVIETSTGIPVTTYVAGRGYTIKINGSQTSATLTLPRFGFQLSAVKTISTTTGAGSLAAVAGTHTVTVAGIKIVEQSSALTGAFVSGTGGAGTTYSVSATWTAPVAGTGGVTFFSVLNAVNFNGSQDVGDKWNNTSVAITELSAITGASSVCVGFNTTLSDVTSGGVWSGGSGFATVGTSGIVTGTSAGVATISYTLGGSTVTKTVSVNGLPAPPAAITGTTNVCVGATTALTDATGGGAWSSTSPGIGSVNASGIVTGLGAGTTTISYTETNACGSVASTTIVTVNPLPAAPAAISGTTNVCVGATTALTDATGGGTWSSTSPGIGSVNTSGIVTGLAAGTTTINYTETNGCGFISSPIVVTVNPLPTAPAAITGTTNVCVGATTALTDATAGGTWSSTSPGIGSVNTSGVVTGLAAGTTTINYTETNGCGFTSAPIVVTVNALPATPAPITGITSLCVTNSSALTDVTPGGVWSSSNPFVGTVATDGTFFAYLAGTTIVNYAVTNSCGSSAATIVVTVNAPPAAISGTPTVCTGANTTLSDISAGGTWSSTNPTAGTVGTSGVVTGISTGTTTISYTVSNGCGTIAATVDLTVNIPPAAPASITGTATVCAAVATTSLSDATAGGTWSSTNPGIGTIGTSGIVTGLTAGTTTISYTVSNSCGNAATTVVVTVNPLPATPLAISGTLGLCNGGATTSLSDATTGGAWSSSNPGVATIGSTGIVTSVSNGTTTISYMVTNGCGNAAATAVVTANAFPSSPSAISGIQTVCTGATTSLSDITAAGTWSSTNPGAGTVGTSGIVTGIGSGTTTISYTLTNSCGSTAATAVVTVNPLPATPAVISGITAICLPGTTSLSDVIAGGVWNSTNTGVATIGTDGVVTGVATGTTTISYTEANSCGNIAVTIIVTVSAAPVAPAAISGTPTVCSGGATTSLSDATTGGTWSSTNTGTATVGSTGIVTSVSTGTTTISYSIANSCGVSAATTVVTVNPLPITPSAISGTNIVCAGATTSLSDAIAGGAWSSANTGVATVSSTGIATGVGGGTTTISYTNTNGCGSAAAAIVVTVNPLPSAGTITGPSAVCTGNNISLTDAVTGGTWFSTNTDASVSGTGLVTGNVSGVDTIFYTVTNACGNDTARKTVTVTSTAIADPITGPTSICITIPATLSDDITGGTWSSSNTTVGTIGSSSGIITGLTTGTTVITYSVTTGCGTATSSVVVTVNAMPSVITGTARVCTGATTTLSDATAGGRWTSSNTAISTIGSLSGIVSGISAGTAFITYTIGVSCITTTIVSVNLQPAPISGPVVTCPASSSVLSDPTPSGIWSSSNTGVASIGSITGIITGVSAGTTAITFQLIAGGCFSTYTETVNPLPGAITGTTNICSGSTSALSETSTGGMWSSSNIAVGTVGSSSGIVSALSAGTTIITYALPSGCLATTVVSVTTQPAAIIGAGTMCAGATSVLSDAIHSGVWTSNNTAVATAGSITGIIMGVSAGTTIISYHLGSCFSTAIETVTPSPAAITGTANVCAGATTTLSNAVTGGSWSSSNVSVGTIGTSSGILTGLIAGTAFITYTLPTGCNTTTVATVNLQPGAILGATQVCAGSNIILSDAPGSGIWTSSSTSIATIGSITGIISGLATGTTVVTYQLAGGCYSTMVETVTPQPANITGTASVCEGSSSTLSDAIAGGTWSSSNITVGTIGTSGILSGLVAGTTNITYALSTGCKTTMVATVNLQPGTILGTPLLCAGANVILSDAPGSGTWTSSNTSVATIGSITGIVSGTAAGTTAITYQLAGGCFSTSVETVDPLPAAITGTASVCAGSTTTLSNTATGGTWSSSNLTVGSIGASSGILTGLIAGTTFITYTLPAGCNTITVATVNLQPGAILGASGICSGATAILSDPLSGSGSWSSSNTSVAAIGSITGIITGLSAGTSTITFSLPAGCFSTAIETINALPAAITGITFVCEGATTTFNNDTTGGSWSSSNIATGSINTSGTFTGISEGTTTITYALSTGCIATVLATVNPQPSIILGPTALCSGALLTLSDSTHSGLWSSSTAIATIGSITGIITAISAGTTTVTYQLPAGCFSTRIETIDPLPATISGVAHVCEGSSTALTDTTSGGSWSSSNIAIGTISTTSGSLTGLLEGTTTITYTTPAGCMVTTVATVNLQPAEISGNANVCPGSITTLTDSIHGGTWSSSNTAIAVIGSVDGIANILATGTVTITYAMAGGCTSTIVLHDTCTTGIETISSTGNIRIFPNPNTGAFFIKGSFGSASNVFAEVLEMTGKVVYQQQLSTKDGEMDQEIILDNTLANGLYLLRLHTVNENIVSHFVILK